MTPARILIVEDDRIVARDLEQQLVRLGHTVVGLAAGADEAVRLAEQTVPDLVLMDVYLDGNSDGIEAAQRIRERVQAPVIYLTAYADEQTIKRASLTQPLGYLLKPFEDTQLRTAIELALYKHSADRKLRESERRYAVTIASLGDAVITTDAQARVDLLNPVAEKLTGWTRAEALGRPLTEVFRIINEDTRAPAEDPAAKVLRLGTVVGLANHTALVTRDGREIAIDDSGAPIIDDEGKVTGVVLVFRDVTQRRQAEQAAVLQEANARLELALRGSDIGIWEFELENGVPDHARVRTINFWQPYGYDPQEEIRYEDVFTRWHPDDRERVDRTVRAFLRGELERYEVVGRMVRKDGASRARLARGIVVRDPNGVARRFIGSSIDITDRIATEDALKESEERFRSTFDNAGAGIVHVELETGALLRANQRFCELSGQPLEALLGRSYLAFCHPDDRSAAVERLEELVRGTVKQYAGEFRLVRPEGASLWVGETVSRVVDAPGARPYAVSILEDLTDRKALELALREAKEVAEASDRAKGEFLANVSHEIRTPMNAILGMTELVLDTELSEDQRKSLRTVKSAATSLLAIINDLLDFSKIEAGKLGLESTDFGLRAALGDLLRTLAVRAHRKGLELVCSVHPDVPDALVGDAGRLRQILINLVGNAIKFTELGEVVVEVELLEDPEPETHAHLRFQVRDTGIGISLDKQASIFRAFEQEDASTTRKYGGTGLGLTIAARLAALMDGRITVESEPGRGSRFFFTARLGRQKHAARHAPAQPPPSLRGLRVLVVDDNEVNRHILEEWLRAWHFEPTAVGDGMAAMDALWHALASGRPFDLVLLDARMPDTDGLAVTARIRERSELASTRIILMTSGDRPGELARFRELRVNAHLLKPVPQGELLESIQSVMSRSGGEPAAPRPPFGAPARVATLSAAPLRVLLAEDNDFNSELLRQLLLKRGHLVQLARDGREALTLAGQGLFDVLLLDLHMPELDGFEVATRLRLSERTRGGHLPIIALTARSQKEDRDRCLAAGMDEFLTKPIDAAHFWLVLDRTLEQARQRSNLGLLDPRTLLAACGGDPAILASIRDAFREHLPDHLDACGRALRAGDAPVLREEAHRLFGMVAAFSPSAAALLSDLEDRAAAGELSAAAAPLSRLEALAPELMRQVGLVTVPALLELEVGP